MNIVLWLTIGGVTGFILTLLIASDRRSTLFRNILAGALAALAAGWLTAPYTGQSATFRAGDLSVSLVSMGIALAGALLVVLVLQFARGSEERRIRNRTRAR
jgi:uncharacterized membrane protein YeaQ/YmgE (transglycosylase-associated protein family)